MQYNVGKKGWVEVITGPMFAGKLEELKEWNMLIRIM